MRSKYNLTSNSRMSIETRTTRSKIISVKSQSRIERKKITTPPKMSCIADTSSGQHLRNEMLLRANHLGYWVVLSLHSSPGK